MSVDHMLLPSRSSEIRYAQPLGWPKSAIMQLAEGMSHEIGQLPGPRMSEIIQEFGGEIQLHDFWDGSDSSGSLHVYSDGKFLVFVPTHTTAERDTFTLAHELGHFILHYLLPRVYLADNEVLVANRYGSEREEWEANWFAAAFLMPSTVFIDLCEKYSDKYYLVARDLGVSEQAARVRARALGRMSSVAAE